MAKKNTPKDPWAGLKPLEGKSEFAQMTDEFVAARNAGLPKGKRGSHVSTKGDFDSLTPLEGTPEFVPVVEKFVSARKSRERDNSLS